jgi:hypothetical protein
MNSEQSHPVTRQEALSALEEIDRVRDHMRRTLAAGAMAPMLILWGVIWTIGFAGEQFMPQAYRLWLVLDLVGVAATFYLGSRPQGSAIKAPGGLRVFASWAVLFAFAALWSFLLYPSEMLHGSDVGAYGPALERKMALLWVTVCMFGYVVMGLWLDRFLLWLGALVTIATLAGFLFEQQYFFLWAAVAGGGSLVLSGLFIRKSWRVAHA